MKSLVRAGSLDARLDRMVPIEAPSAFLMVTEGLMPGRLYPLTHNTVVLGRGSDSDIQLDDPSVSGRHARILNRPHAFEVEDLGSTNGTFIEDRAVTRSPLLSGQRLRLGSIEFKLLLDPKAQPTMTLVPALMPAIPSSPNRVQSLPAPRRARNEDDEESGPSLQEMLGKGIRAYRASRRYFASAAVVLGITISLALVSVFAMPGGATAQCEVKFHPEERSSPVEGASNGGTKTSTLFQSPERAFINGALVMTTLQALGFREPTNEQVDAVVARLKLENIMENTYVASFSEGMFPRTRYDLVNLLTSHIKTYVQDETDKALMVSVKETDFLKSQVVLAEKDLAALDAELRLFKEENLSALPESASLTLGSRAQMETRRIELTAQIERMNGEIQGVKNQISSEGPLSTGQSQTSSAYRSRLANLKEKLAELRAKDLTDDHPEVRALIEEKKSTEGLIEAELSASATDLERRTSPELHALEVKLHNLQSANGGARTELGELINRLRAAKRLETEMPRVDARLQELLLKQEDQRKLYSQLFEQLKKAEVRLQLERVSVSSRHEMASPVRLATPRKSKMGLQRLAIAVGFSFIVIAFMIVFRELKPMLRAAWDSAEARENETSRR